MNTENKQEKRLIPFGKIRSLQYQDYSDIYKRDREILYKVKKNSLKNLFNNEVWSKII